MPWLTTEGASHQIAEGETIVGSGPNAGWRLDSHDLAVRHFVLHRSGPRVTIRPSGIDAVVALNGAQIGARAVELQDGDTIDAGTGRFLYSGERSGSFPAVTATAAHLVETRDRTTHALATPSVGIGRDRINAIVVRDPTASRFHAEIRREAGGYVLHPRGSSGTLLNGRQVGSPERLKDGDRVEIGNVEFRFVSGAIPADARPAVRAADDGSGHRPTVVQSVITEIPDEDKHRSWGWLWIVAMVAIAASVYLATR